MSFHEMSFHELLFHEIRRTKSLFRPKKVSGKKFASALAEWFSGIVSACEPMGRESQFGQG
jgi:hypothetical protein